MIENAGTAHQRQLIAFRNRDIFSYVLADYPEITLLVRWRMI